MAAKTEGKVDGEALANRGDTAKMQHNFSLAQYVILMIRAIELHLAKLIHFYRMAAQAVREESKSPQPCTTCESAVAHSMQRRPRFQWGAGWERR